MRFIKKQTARFSNIVKYQGIKKGFIFSINIGESQIYISVNHKLKDIRFNSLWQSITFETKEKAIEWCENFKPENFNCLGDDFKIN